MESEHTPKFAPRRPEVASLLSSLFPGLGHIYCGRLARGLAIYAISMMTIMVLIVLIVLLKGRFGTAVFGVGIPYFVFDWLVRWDVQRIAARTPKDYVPKEYNRWYLYATLVGVFMVVAVCGAFVIRQMAYEAFVLIDACPEVALQKGDRVLVNKTIYDVQPMQRSDVVMVRGLGVDRKKKVWRLAGLPGDEVIQQDGQLFVNGQSVHSLPISMLADTEDASTTPEIRVIPEDEGLFVRRGEDSSESEWVITPLVNVIGRVECVYWPRPRGIK